MKGLFFVQIIFLILVSHIGFSQKLTDSLKNNRKPDNISDSSASEMQEVKIEESKKYMLRFYVGPNFIANDLGSYTDFHGYKLFDTRRKPGIGFGADINFILGEHFSDGIGFYYHDINFQVNDIDPYSGYNRIYKSQYQYHEHYLGLPFNLNYDFKKNKLQFYIGVGLALNIVKDLYKTKDYSELAGDRYDAYYYFHSTEYENKVFLAFSARIGLRYDIMKNWKVFAEPNISWFNYFISGVATRKIFVCNLGASYSFGKLNKEISNQDKDRTLDSLVNSQIKYSNNKINPLDKGLISFLKPKNVLYNWSLSVYTGFFGMSGNLGEKVQPFDFSESDVVPGYLWTSFQATKETETTGYNFNAGLSINIYGEKNPSIKTGLNYESFQYYGVMTEGLYTEHYTSSTFKDSVVYLTQKEDKPYSIHDTYLEIPFIFEISVKHTQEKKIGFEVGPSIGILLKEEYTPNYHNLTFYGSSLLGNIGFIYYGSFNEDLGFSIEPIFKTNGSLWSLSIYLGLVHKK